MNKLKKNDVSRDDCEKEVILKSMVTEHFTSVEQRLSKKLHKLSFILLRMLIMV